MKPAAMKTAHDQRRASRFSTKDRRQTPPTPFASNLSYSLRARFQTAPIRVTAVALATVWALGVATSYLGRFVHILAIVAVALLLFDLVMKRRARHGESRR